MSKDKIRIDIFSDIVCPWCYIGKKRLERAVQQLDGKFEFEIHYFPFELNPNVPLQGFDQKKYLGRKFGGEERYRQITDQVTQIAAEEGLRFNFEKQLVSPNTFDMHKIVWYAGKVNKQSEVAEAFFKAYFEEGIDLTKPENLLRISKEAGLEEEKVTELLETDFGLKEVKTLLSLNSRIGIQSVPFYIVNEKYSISGAQPSEIFVQAFEQIVSATSQGQSCDVDKSC